MPKSGIAWHMVCVSSALTDNVTMSSKVVDQVIFPQCV